MWPTSGRITSNYKADDSSRKGIDISGQEGQPIIAAAPGEVVYSGSGMIAYGELIIIKHSDQFLSAYAHNRKRLGCGRPESKSRYKNCGNGQE